MDPLFYYITVTTLAGTAKLNIFGTVANILSSAKVWFVNGIYLLLRKICLYREFQCKIAMLSVILAISKYV